MRATWLTTGATLATGAALFIVILGIYVVSDWFADQNTGIGRALMLIGLGGLTLFAGIAISAGHFAARFDLERPRISAAVASLLSVSLVLCAFLVLAKRLPLIGTLIAVGIVVFVAVLIAGLRARRNEV